MRRVHALTDHLTMILVGLAVVLACTLSAGGADRQPSLGAAPLSAYPIPGDRWMEIDLYWFEQKDIGRSVKTFWDRFQPLYTGVQGYRGVILNVGWTVSCVMEWSGNLDQHITLPKGSGEQHWVDARGPLTGSTEERMRKWKERFRNPLFVEHRGYEAWTYRNLLELSAHLRQEAAQRGIKDFKVGMLNYAMRNAYGEVPPWVARHSETFTKVSPGVVSWTQEFAFFDPSTRLHADPTRLGGLPEGIPEGMPVHQAYAAQWGSLSKAVGLDAIMLRDSFGMPVPYQRWGPWGPLAPSPEVIREATAVVAMLVREVKTANPGALVMMYSNAASAVGDWRANGLDLESVAKEGYLDIFVDQTWAGAWNEVGLRETQFWNAPLLGWTYQLGYVLLHAAILADTRVRHYPLIETFDAWEDWDVIHTAPERLRWGIWAYSHATVKTPKGLKLPAGSYISWANQGKRLLGTEDVRFLADNLNATIADARQTAEVFGPTLVYSRESMQWQIAHATPHHDIKEWIDEQAASVMKWPVPILSVTRVEWLPQVKSDLFILQTPSHLAPEHTAHIAKLMTEGHPIAIFGSPASGVDPEIDRLGGLSPSERSGEDRATAHLAQLTGTSPTFAAHIPETFKTFYQLTRNQAAPDARVLYSVEGNPVLTLDTAQGKRIVMWDPSDMVFKVQEQDSLAVLWGSSGAPYALVAGALNYLMSSSNVLHAKDIDLSQTMNVTAWRAKDGVIRILAANLEEGLRDDADMTRHAIVVLPASWKTTTWTDTWSRQTFEASRDQLRINLGQADSVLMLPMTH
jgi:hypothetical protein